MPSLVAAYFGASMLATVLLLLGALVGMRVFYIFSGFVAGDRAGYRIKPLLFDAFGFAAAAAGTALVQYYLVSLLQRFGIERGSLSALVSFTALFCGLFFWRGALFSSLGAYGFSGLSVTLAALIGGLAAVFQKQEDNPWPASAPSCFK